MVINEEFLFVQYEKSKYSNIVWDKIKQYVLNDTPEKFYCRLFLTVMRHFYEWYITSIHLSHKYKIPIDHNLFVRIIDHVIMISCIACNIPNKIDNIKKIYKSHANSHIEYLDKHEHVPEIRDLIDHLIMILYDTVNTGDNILIDDGVKWFDGIGTVIWLWIHLTASGITIHAHNMYNEYYHVFKYLKYILSCGICKHHYDTDIIPVLNKIIETNKSNILNASIDIHTIVNVNKFKSRSDVNLMFTNITNQFNDGYIKYWN